MAVNGSQLAYQEEDNANAAEKSVSQKQPPAIRVSPELHTQLQDIAEEQSRTLKATTEIVLKKGLDLGGRNRGASAYKMNEFGELI